jgi:putative ABC transport system permease protein
MMRRLVLRLLTFLRPGRAEDALDREVASHLALLEDEYRRRGLTPEEARFAARRAMGSVALAKDLHRDARSFGWLEDLREDLRHTFRGLRQAPAFTATAALTLALGIGGTTTIFSVAYGVLVRPLPYADPDRLVRLWEEHPGASTPTGDLWISNLTYYAWNGRSRVIGPIATYGSTVFTVGVEEPVRVSGARVSTSAFDVLRVVPALGRFFTAADQGEGAPQVVVLSNQLWRSRFNADPSVVGRTFVVDRVPHVVVGVAPPGFSFPDRDAQLWIPTSVPYPLVQPTGAALFAERAMARLRDGSTPAQAAAEGTVVARAQPRSTNLDGLFGKGGPVEVRARTLADDMTARVQRALVLGLGAFACLLLIACANVANLMLARGMTRERDLSLRVALGATRGRLVRKLLTEGVVLAGLGGALGVALAAAVVRMLPGIVPPDFPRLDAVRLDWTVLSFSCAVSAMAGVIASLVPALRSARIDILPVLRVGQSTARSTIRSRRVILVVQASVAVVLLVAATLLGRSLFTLLAVDGGYVADGVLTALVYPPASPPGQAGTDDFFPQLLQRLRSMPGVIAAGAGTMAPFGRSTSTTTMAIPVLGRAPVAGRSRVYVVTPGYAEALRLRLVSGRFLNEADLAASTQSLLVNEAFVRTFLTGVEPLGFVVDSILSRDVRAEIVGVVGNVLKDGLDTEPQPEVYVVPAHRYALRNQVNIVVRTSTDPIALAAPLREALRSLRSDVAVDTVTTLAAQTAESVATERLSAMTFMILSAMATLLTAVGLYGVLSHLVASRARELSVRTALGATRRHVALIVMGDGMGTVLVGLAIGLGLAAGLTRLMQTMLFGIDPLDPWSFVLAVMFLSAVALVACFLPARRAARIDPMSVLRAE